MSQTVMTPVSQKKQEGAISGVYHRPKIARGQFFNRLINPSTRVTDPIDRRNARLLMVFFIIDQMIQLFEQLVANAIKFRNNASPEIQVHAEKSDRTRLFSVNDNGLGIDPDYHDRIFEIFKKLHPNAAYPGTGVGLAICKRIIERHEGKIWVESTRGDGATFFFTLPDIRER